MANVQGTVYGHSDCWGIPFDLYSGAVSLVSGATINMQTGILVLNPAASLTGIVINLPLNPPDGAMGEIYNCAATGITIAITVNANTGDSFAPGNTAPTSLAAITAAGSSANGVRYKYSLNGVQLGNTFVAPRSWFRVQ
jgi:hypothetical protein